MTKRDFRAPAQRPVHRTAYTLQRNEHEVDVGVGGVDLKNAGANVGYHYGVGAGGQIGINLAHASLAILSAELKWNFVDRRWWALGAEADILFARPRYVWLLPSDIRDDAGNLSLLSVPLRLRLSFPVSEWFSFHVSPGYTASAVFGDIERENETIETGAGLRLAFVEVITHFYIAGRVMLFAGGFFPYHAQARVNIAGERQIEEGLVVGTRITDWRSVPFSETYRAWGGVELRFGRKIFTHLQLFASVSPLSRLADIPVSPGLNLYWRI